ncbi:hypothetical protein OPIT5_03925 [Opitutaceae bacterium TAV5]|nr:hypothetical protein OPIT5_03925 [Opitutaceae bacterium TAV5]
MKTNNATAGLAPADGSADLAAQVAYQRGVAHGMVAMLGIVFACLVLTALLVNG